MNAWGDGNPLRWALVSGLPPFIKICHYREVLNLYERAGAGEVTLWTPLTDKRQIVPLLLQESSKNTLFLYLFTCLFVFWSPLGSLWPWAKHLTLLWLWQRMGGFYLDTRLPKMGRKVLYKCEPYNFTLCTSRNPGKVVRILSGRASGIRFTPINMLMKA